MPSIRACIRWFLSSRRREWFLYVYAVVNRSASSHRPLEKFHSESIAIKNIAIYRSHGVVWEPRVII